MDINEIERVEVTRLRRDTAELLNCVCYGGERFVVTSSRKDRAALVSVGDLERLLRLLQEEGKPQEINDGTAATSNTATCWSCGAEIPRNTHHCDNCPPF